LYDEDPLIHGELGHAADHLPLPSKKRPLKSSAGHLYRIHCVHPSNERGEDNIITDLSQLIPSLQRLTGRTWSPPCGCIHLWSGWAWNEPVELERRTSSTRI
jgi:hypothetical protein